MGYLAVIGGSGFASLPDLDSALSLPVETCYGRPSAELIRGRLGGSEVLFLARHGAGHQIPPHRIDYRANIQALAEAGAERIVALAAVGGIADDCAPLTLCVPDQLIDYTYGRDSTFYDGRGGGVVHVDFTTPFSESLRAELLSAGRDLGLEVRAGGTYGVTQGPRLETAAEIERMRRDGCDLVGMTAMPEAVLARERGLQYATLGYVVNWAAGRPFCTEIRADEIEANLARCTARVRQVLVRLGQRAVAASASAR
jgi:5'-methylthioadenosine phosphorylase/5'-methylthioinosine phosphorylase